MDMPTAVAIVGSIGVITGGGVSILRTLYGKQDINELSKKIIIVMSDIASIKQAFINLVVFITEDTSEAKILRDKIIEAMMKHPSDS